ncbi:hypothetical protein SEVIR_1G231266v4 [Setaria viridis]
MNTRWMVTQSCYLSVSSSFLTTWLRASAKSPRSTTTLLMTPMKFFLWRTPWPETRSCRTHKRKMNKTQKQAWQWLQQLIQAHKQSEQEGDLVFRGLLSSCEGFGTCLNLVLSLLLSTLAVV